MPTLSILENITINTPEFIKMYVDHGWKERGIDIYKAYGFKYADEEKDCFY